jgi:hypothetical protein
MNVNALQVSSCRTSEHGVVSLEACAQISIAALDIARLSGDRPRRFATMTGRQAAALEYRPQTRRTGNSGFFPVAFVSGKSQTL